MFGPLNGPRTILVAGATVAALFALAFGWWGAAILLLVAVGLHGLGWLYLYRRAQEGHDYPG